MNNKVYKGIAICLCFMAIGFLLGFAITGDQYKKTVQKQNNYLIDQQKKIARYEHIITDMMQGQWTPEMGIQKEFIEEFYGTEIWAFKAVNRPPGSKVLNVGEIIDRQIENQSLR